MLNGLVRTAALGLHHVEIVVRVRLLPDQFRQELQPVNFVDRVAEIRDAASEVKDHYQGRIYLVRRVRRETCALGIERRAQFTKLRCQACALPAAGWFGQAWQIACFLFWSACNLWWPECQEGPRFGRHPVA